MKKTKKSGKKKKNWQRRIIGNFHPEKTAKLRILWRAAQPPL